MWEIWRLNEATYFNGTSLLVDDEIAASSELRLLGELSTLALTLFAFALFLLTLLTKTLLLQMIENARLGLN